MTFPNEFINLIKRDNLIDYNILLDSFDKAPTISIRLNPLKVPNLIGDPVKWSENAIYLNERPNFTYDPLFHAGTYYVQETGSMFISEIIKQLNILDEDSIVLDLCAAPGGKSTHLLSLMDNKGLLISNEIIKSRAEVLKENIIKWAYPNCIVTNNKPSDFNKLESLFDIILIDAPCSGEGMFRKDPKTINEWSLENVDYCHNRQINIIKDVWNALKPEGYLIYSTCTFNTKENEEVISELSNYEIIDIDISHLMDSKILKSNSFLRFIPGYTNSEGFSITVIQKKEGNYKNYRPKFSKKFKKIKKFDDDVLKADIKNNIFEFDSNLYYFNELIQNYISFFENLYIKYAGINLGTLNNKIFKPSHSLALSKLVDNNYPKIDLSLEDSIKYLKKENLEIDIKNGNYLITHKDFGLGFAKIINHKLNNYYPTNLRILK